MMETSPEIKNVAAAILAAQKCIGSAKKGAVNPFFKSKYADLGAVIEVCKDALNEAGISCLQPVISDGPDTFVETILLHTSGEWIKSRQRVIVKAEHDPQAQGSAITYARRYSLQSLVLIPAEDDDGNRATKPNGAGVSHPPPNQPPAPPPTQPAGIAEIIGAIANVEEVEGRGWKITVTKENGEAFICGTPSKEDADEARKEIGIMGVHIQYEANGKKKIFKGVLPF